MNKWIKLIIYILIFVDLLFLSTLHEVFAILFALYIAYLILIGVKLYIMYLGKIMRSENKNKVKKQVKNTKT